MHELEKIAAIIITTGAVMTAAIAIIKGYNKFMDWVFEKKRDQHNLAWLAEMKSDIKDIAKEHKPNGGESLKDAVQRIDIRTENMLHRLENVEENKVDK